MLAPEFVDEERFRQRFLRESQVAASLHHPHITPTVTSGDAEGRLFLAMAYIDGPDLRELLHREGSLEPERAIALISQVAEALDAAHRAGLVHRDVKPGNILVASLDGRGARLPLRLRPRAARIVGEQPDRGSVASSARSTTSRRSRSRAG